MSTAAPTPGPATVSDVSSFTPDQKAAFNAAAAQSSGQATSTNDPSQARNALIVTSSASRTNYANNVNSMQQANSNLSSNTNTGSNTNTAANTNTGTTGGSATPSITINTGSGGSSGKTGGLTSDQMQSMGIKDSTGWTQDPSSGLFSPPAGGASTDTANPSPDGSDPTTGLPPAIASQFKSALSTQDQSIKDAKTTLDAATATLNNDPAAQAAAAAISAKYDVLINAMKDKNKIVLGSYSKNAARNGGFEYANDMTSTFMSNEMDRANQRVADLVTQEQDMILKSNQAYKNGDLKAFNDAQSAYDKANNDKISAISKLLSATNAQVKLVQAQTKIDAAAEKQKVTTDISKSTNLGKSLAENLKNSGVTDSGEIDSYIQSMADQYGITNPDILKSAVVKAQQDQQKLDQTQAKTDASLDNTADSIKNRDARTGASLNNTADSIKNRDARTNIAQQNANKKKTPKPTGGGKDGGYAYTGDDVTTYTSFLNTGGTEPNGQVYNGRGTDGYVDPGSYAYAYKDWIAHNGTPQGFVKKFPITNVNPASYGKLPEAIRPKAKTNGPA